MPYAENYSTNSANFNIGVNKDYLVPDFIHKGCFIPKDKHFTQSEEQTMFATLLALISSDTPDTRIYPFGNIIDFNGKSTDAVVTTSAVGTPLFVHDGKYGMQFTWSKGGIQLFNKIRKMFHLAQDRFDFIWFDKAANCVIGTKAAGNTLNRTKKGFTIDLIQVEKMEFNTGNEGAKFRMTIILSDPDEITERISITQCDADLEPLMSLNGLKDLEFVTYPQPYQVITSGVAKVRITTGGGATELFSLMASGSTTFASALVALTASFVFKDASNNTLTCAVSLDATTNTIVFTFSGAAFTALTSGAIITCTSPTITQMNATIPGYANSTFYLKK